MQNNLHDVRTNLLSVCLLTLTALFGPQRFAQAAFINQQPQSTNVLAGSNATFTVVAGGTAPLSYRWSFNGTNLTNGGRISGANTSNLLITAAVPGDAGGYRVVVSNGVSSVTSVVATLTVLLPPAISDIPNQRTFHGMATRAIPFTVSNVPAPVLLAGSSNPSLVPTNNIVFSGSGSNWTVTVTPAGSSLGSSTITVTVADSFGHTASKGFMLTVGDFTEAITNFPGLAGGIVRWMDFDNDGRLDLYVSGSDFNSIAQTHLYHNNGDGTFTEVPLSPTNLLWPFTNSVTPSADWADFDGDGYADLVAEVQPYAGDNYAWTYVFKNNGGTNLTPVASLPTPYTDETLIWADVDNDGRPDILQITIGGTWVYHNNGDGTFSMVSIFPGSGFGAVADYDGDGWIDVMEPGYYFGAGLGSRLYRNVGTNGFMDSGLNFAAFYGGFAAWGDVNNDGRPDVLLTGFADTPDGTQTVLYRNDGGTFTVIATNLPSLRNSIAVWGDCDNDGKSDLFLTGFNSSGYQGKIFHNNGNETFTDLGIVLPGFNNGSAAWGDYDNDGALDLAVMGSANGGPPVTKLYHNDGAMPDTPPTAPTGLAVTRGPNSALLSWTAATDAEQSGGLTYNVRMGTVTNGINIVSPMSDLVTGFRRVPKTGNAGYRLSFLITNLPAGAYYWSVQAIDNAYEGSLFAPEQSFNLPAPVITNQPTDLTVLAGSPATFTVGAAGAPPLGYQWQVNGTNISGATNVSLTINPAGFTDQGAYSVTVNNQFGSITSSNAVLTVLTPPSLTQQPQSQTNVVGSLITFTAAATGTTPFSYQWFFNGVPLSDNGHVYGSASNVLSIASVLKSDAGLYWLVVTNNYGAATSAVVSLGVTAPDVLINVDFGSGTQSLKTGPAAIGQTATDFWNFYNVGIPGLTNLLMANGAPTLASVTVSGAGPVAPVNGNPDPMYGQYLYQCCLPGNLTVVTTNLPPGTYDFYYYAGCGDYNYALSINGVSQGQRSVFGSGSSSTNWQEGVHYVAFRGVTLTNSTSSVQVVITYLDSVCLEAVISGMQIAETFPGPTAPFFVSQPASQTLVSGFNANFRGGAFGAPAPGYQWFFNNVPLANNGHVTGADTFSLVVSSAQPADNGNYFLVASNSAGASTSQVATLTVQLLPPSFVSQPTNQVIPPGGNVVFSAPATGSIPIGYQWFFNGAPLADNANTSGSTSPTLVISPAQTNHTGSYFVVASNNVNMTTSSVAMLFVGVPPGIVQPPVSQTNFAGTTAVFSVLASGTPPLSYQWQLNGSTLADDPHRSGSAAANLIISNAQPADAGNYAVIITNGAGSVTSLVATLTVWTAPTITTQPIGRSVPLGLPTTFNAAATSTAPLPVSYQWRLNGTDISRATNTSYAIAAVGINDPGIYQFVASNAVGVAVSSNALLTIGPVAAWGNNASGQALPPPGLSNVVAIAACSTFSLALKGDGTVVAWGSGPGTNVPAGLNNVAGIAAGSTFGLGVRSDGTVVAWGSSAATNVPGSISNVILTSGSSSHALALRREGVVVDWGASRTPVPAGLTKVVSIADSPGFSLAARADGTVTAWGSLSLAGLVNPNPPVPLSNVVSVACGTAHAVALKSDGTVFAWGSGTAVTNVPAGLTNAMAIAAASMDQAPDYTLALRTNGLVVGWGANSSGVTNILPGLSNVVAIAAGSTHSLALVSGGAPVILGQPVGGTAFSGNRFALNAIVSGQAPLTYAWSLNGTNLPNATNASYIIFNAQPVNAGFYSLTASNALGVAVSVSAPVVVVDSAPFILTSPGATNRPYIASRFTLSVAVAGSGPPLLQWQLNGQNLMDQTNVDLVFGRVRRTNSGNYTLVASNSFGAVTSSVAGLFPVSVAAWGISSYGATNVPVNLTNAIAIAINNENAAALRADGSVATWGFSGSSVPTDVSNIVEIAASSSFYLALRTNGTVRGWFTTTAFSNSLASLTNIVAIEADAAAGTFLKPDGTVVRILNSGPIVAFPQLSNVVALSKFYDGFAALRADGTVFTSGSGSAPPASATSNVLDIALESSYGATLKRDGSIQTWGLYAKQTTNFPGNMIAVSANASVQSNGTVTAWMWSPNYPALLNVPPGLASVGAVDASSILTLSLLVAHDFPQGLLPDALDTTALVVSSRSAPRWFAQTNTTHDGVGAAQSADLDNNTASSMRLWVAGPVNVSFWWKVSSETNHDFLSFSAGGVLLTNISGETGWRPCALSIPAGNQILQWTYAKDAGGSAGQDAGWVDQLVITPIAPSIVTQPQNQTVIGPTNVTLSVSAEGTPPMQYQWLKNGGPLAGAGNFSLNLLGVTRTNSGTYSVVITNLGGSITSSNAILRVMVPQLLQLPTINPDGSVAFTSGDSDGGLLSSNDIANFTISASTNLVDWQALSSVPSLTNGMLRFQDFGATNYPQQFYRVIENP